MANLSDFFEHYIDKSKHILVFKDFNNESVL